MDAVRQIVAEEGITGLYSGIHGSLLGVASTNFAYFYWYSTVRTLYLASRQPTPSPPSTPMELSMGALAGALAQLCTIPVAVVTTRQQTQPRNDKKGLLDTAREVVNSDDGWTGLWRGLKASLVLVVNPSITYGAYERLRVVLFQGRAKLAPWEAFRKSFHTLDHMCLFDSVPQLSGTLYYLGFRVCADSALVLGAISKALATIVTQPLIVAKVGLQSRPPPSRNGKPFKSFVEVMSFIVEHEGLLGLFKGITPQILKGLIVQGILMMTKERYVYSFPESSHAGFILLFFS